MWRDLDGQATFEIGRFVRLAGCDETTDQDPELAGLRVYQHEIDEKGKTLKLWVRRKRATGAHFLRLRVADRGSSRGGAA